MTSPSSARSLPALACATSRSAARGESTSSTSTPVNWPPCATFWPSTGCGFPVLVRPSARYPSTMNSRLIWSGCGTPLTSPNSSRRRTSGFSPSSSPRGPTQIAARMSALAEVAAGTDVTLVHENEKDIYGDIPRRCLDIVTSVTAPQLQLAWDPANFVQVGVRPFTEGYAMLRPYVSYIQIKDALLADASVVVAGAGDGEVVETVHALRDDGFDGFFSLEPHLGDVSSAGAWSGPELFTQAWKAFTDILSNEGIEYA